MLKVLIVCKENQTAKKIINKIVVKNEDLKIVGIANTLEETKDLFKVIEADLIITTNRNIVNLVKNKFIAHQPSIVLISKTKMSTVSTKKVLHLDYSLSFSEMAKKISMFIRKNLTSSDKEVVTEMLLKLGFDFKLSGTLFLLDAIVYARTFKGTYSFETLAKDIYTYVAENNNTTVKRVKWSIERPIHYMHKKCTKEDYKNIEKCFKIEYPEKLTPKLVINVLVNQSN